MIERFLRIKSQGYHVNVVSHRYLVAKKIRIERKKFEINTYYINIINNYVFLIFLQDKVERDYEECLRTEIFRWQAPEFFHGLALTTKSDVYGLSLLLWEIGTGRFQCSFLSL